MKNKKIKICVVHFVIEFAYQVVVSKGMSEKALNFQEK